MIRPFTAICCALAAGAVLYTYQSKHDVQLLDRQIEKTLGDTATLREQSRALKAEWTLRENPERLKTFADQYLALKPVAPTQFTTLAELDTRLPAPRIGTQDPDPANTTEEPDAAPMASGTGQPEAPEENVADADDLPLPPLPVPPPPLFAALQATPPPAAPAAPAPAAPAPMAERKPPPPKPVPARPPAMQAAAPAPPIQAQIVRAAPMQGPPPRMAAQPASMPAPTAAAAMPAPQPAQNGSLLGMARGGSFAPTPRPIPVNATQWTNGN